MAKSSSTEQVELFDTAALEEEASRAAFEPRKRKKGPSKLKKNATQVEINPEITIIDSVEGVGASKGGDSSPEASNAFKPNFSDLDFNLEDFQIALLGLSRVEGLGFLGIRSLYDYYQGHLDQIWSSDSESIAAVLLNARVGRAHQIAFEIVEKRDDLLNFGALKASQYIIEGISILPDHKIPKPLRDLKDYPRWLFVQGNPSVLYTHPMVAIVGTRTPSAQGIRATTAVNRLLAPYPVTVVSGLATGIDEEAHRASLAEGKKNVAFLGHGIDIVFPAATADLREQIIEEGGAIVSEYLPHESYVKRYFVQRNRLQAALCDLLIPVEATLSSGTAHTINFALKFQRPIAGIRWNGDTELLTFLANKNQKLFNVNTTIGRKSLDKVLQDLVNANGLEAWCLERGVKQLLREMDSRSYTREDLDRVVDELLVKHFEDSKTKC